MAVWRRATLPQAHRGAQRRTQAHTGADVARELGISGANAVALQRIAALQLGFAVPHPGSLALVSLALLVAGNWRRRSQGLPAPDEGQLELAATGRPLGCPGAECNFGGLRHGAIEIAIARARADRGRSRL